MSTESNTTVSDQARQEATEKSLEVGKHLSRKLTGRRLPSVDLTQPVARFFTPLQKGIDLNRNLAAEGAELLAGVRRHFREQTQRVRSIVKEQTDPVADLSNAQAERERAERETAERETAEREHAERETAEREHAERETAEREHAEREHAEREQA